MSKESIPSNHMEIYWHDYANMLQYDFELVRKPPSIKN